MITNVNIICNRDPKEDDLTFAISFIDFKVIVFRVARIDRYTFINKLQLVYDDPQAADKLREYFKLWK